MDKKNLSEGQQKLLAMFLFYFLLFSYPLLSFLWRRSYPMFATETLAIFAILAASCLILAFLLVRVRPWIVSVFSALLITATFIVQFNLLLAGLVICAVVCLCAAWWLGTRFHLYGLPVLALLILGALVDSFADDGERVALRKPVGLDQQLPPVVHIILDSFAGMEGFPPYESSGVIRNEVYSFFNYYNFQVFPRAYSPYTQTGDSLYSALNFENKSETGFGLEVFNRKAHVMKSNAQFDTLEDLGYHSRIYQPEHIDFCQSNPENLDRCWTYAQPNVTSIQAAKDLPTRVEMVVGVLLKQSTILSDLMVSGGWMSDLGIAVHDPRMVTMLGQDIASFPDGNLFFAHLLLPHGPYAFSNDCEINYETANWTRYATTRNEPVLNDAAYEARAGLYFKQMGCALLSMGRIFEYMKSTGIFDRAIIVIHGDHGSMIGKHQATVQNLEKLTGEEYRANYSTLFAVKFPNGGFSMDNRVLPLSSLLKGFTSAVQAFVTDPDQPTLMDIPDDQNPHVYLTGTYPLMRQDINIFEE